MKQLVTATAAFLLLFVFDTAHAQQIFVQVDISGDVEGCSILRIDPDGTLTEVVSNADIQAVTGETECDVDDTGIVVADNGTIYFTEDVSHDVLQVAPDATVSVLVDSETLDALIGTSADADSGLDIGPDGNLYLGDEDCDCILQITPSGTASIFIENADILAATGKPEANLEGGLAFGDDGSLYFVEDGSFSPRNEDDELEDDGDRGNGSADEERVLVANSAGEVSVLTTDAEIILVLPDDATSTNLDVDIVFAAGTLYVSNDGDFSALIAIDPSTGIPSLVVDGDEVISALGIDQEDSMDPEGGLGFDPSNGSLLLALDTFDETISDDQANIARVTPSGEVSLVVSDAEITAFYEALYGSANDFRFEGGLDIFGGDLPQTQSVPTLSPLALTLLALMVLGIATLTLPRLRA